jgi:hypothetical protein
MMRWRGESHLSHVDVIPFLNLLARGIRRTEIFPPFRQLLGHEIVDFDSQRFGKEDQFQVRNPSRPALDLGNCFSAYFKSDHSTPTGEILLRQFLCMPMLLDTLAYHVSPA